MRPFAWSIRHLQSAYTANARKPRPSIGSRLFPISKITRRGGKSSSAAEDSPDDAFPEGRPGQDNTQIRLAEAESIDGPSIPEVDPAKEVSVPSCPFVFDTEEETDYTSFAPQMVVVNDGMKECAAIMLDQELSTKIQEAVRLTREIAQEERVFHDKHRVIAGYLSKVSSHHWETRAQLNDVVWRGNSENTKQADSLRATLQRLDEMQQKGEMDRQHLEKQIGARYQRFFKVQEEANAIFDQILVGCNLLQAQSEQLVILTSELDFERDFFQDAPLGDLEIPLHYTPSQGGLGQRTIREYYREAREKLEAAYLALDRRAQVKMAEWDLIRSGGLPLKTAEIDVKGAKIMAFDQGVDLKDPNQESLFLDEDEQQREARKSLGGIDPWINEWLQAVPSQHGSEAANKSPEDVFLDEWDATSVDLCDSASLVDGRPDRRRRIDKWQAAMEEARLSG
ncbi:hypothetical protein H2203_001408 [Taxawa tesnikishii (nom. ined.)]|nr:hypothetical protein H2203_001408 [Dothideales sp. JES 119]